uniref:Reverse transcriptase domain-containing protein n=1 Tax=Tanacetum cinerariifolium TaxID=118510 RepID=A0A6L2J7N7_TANCI|nr:reverse transcriptase domain-containing protein [Tanacetum cinerariifolium]
MRTRSKSYPNNSNATVPRRSNRRRVPNIVEPEIRTIEEVVPMADRTMEELLQAPTEGYGEAIVILEILAENFEIKTNLLQEAWERFKEMLRACPHHGFSELTQIDTFYNRLNEQDQDSLNAAVGGNLLTKTTREALNIIENKSKVCYSRSKSNVSRVNTNSRNSASKTDDRIDKLADQILNLVEIVNKQVITPATAKAVEKTCVIYGDAHVYYDCIATDSNQPSVCAATGIPNELSSYMKSNEIMIKSMQNQINVLRGDFNKQEENLRRNLNNDMRSILGSFFQNQASTSGTLPSNIVPNPKGEMKVVTTRSGLAYEGPSIPTNSPLEKVVKRDTEETTKKEHSNCQGSTAHIQPPVVPISIPEPDVPRTQPKPNIPYPSRLNNQKLCEKTTTQMEKFFQIFHDLHFDISFVDALLLMPKFASTIKSLLRNKDKLFGLAEVPLNENCSAMLLKKLLEKLGDPSKFLIPCDFLMIDVCHALADLGASINLMPLSIWKKLSLPELTPTWMTLELADRSITRPKGVAEDAFVKVGRSFLRTGRALIDVYGEEITLRFNDESVTFNLNQTMRYSSTYDDNYVNRVDVIGIACEEFVQDVLDFQYNSKSSNPTLVSSPTFSESKLSKEPIVKSSSPTLTPFGESDFFLEKIEDFLNDESIPTGIENYFYDPEGDILYLEKLLNEDPFQLPPMDLKQAEETKAKSSIKEPPELELKELPSHLEYAFLEDTDKLPVIIAKHLKDVEKEALIKEDYKPAVQSQRRVNLKIHDVIKKEVIKLFDAGMIYPISNSPWVSPIHCVPKKGGMTVVANENNELIPTSVKLEKCHFMCKEEIVLGHKISKSRIEVDRAKVDVIAKLPHPTTVKGVRSFLGHAGSENLASDHLSRLENPYKDVLENKDINENFPLETLGSLSSSSSHGPFTITQVFPYGTVELSQPNGPNFKVNGHLVKHYFGGDIPSKIVPDLHTFPMDK